MKKWSIMLFISFITLGCYAQVQRNVATKKDTADIKMKDETSNSENGLSKRENNREILRSLNLTKEQRQKLKEIHQANRTKKEIIENNNQLSESQKKDQLKELHKETTVNMKNLLSEDQWNKIKELRKNE